MNRLLIFVLIVLLPATGWTASLDQIEKAPAGWRKKVFAPNFKFPETTSKKSQHPWSTVDFKTAPDAYLGHLLKYFLEGQNTKTWHPADNSARQWYHAPWLGPGKTGREFISGLTRGRNSQPGELGAQQTTCHQNWALVLYDPVAASTLGRIWAPVHKGKGEPDLSQLPFAAGSVVVKLQFSGASPKEVPQLTGAPTLTANVHERYFPDDTGCPPLLKRVPAKLRLLQIDVAVRDPRAAQHTGWVFGSFGHDGRRPGTKLTSKLVPLGLTWGNDSELSDGKSIAPTQSVVLSKFGLDRPLGRSGRMNGPIDSAKSSCISCHSTAQWPNAARLTPPDDAKWDVAQCWFRNLSSDQAFGVGPSAQAACGSTPAGVTLQATDYSFMVAIGVRNWLASKRNASRSFGGQKPMSAPLLVDGITSAPMERGGN